MDVLADMYDRLLRKHNITPLVRTKYSKAENLTEKFETNRFDLVYARNSIDHSQDPLKAVREMIAVVKPDRYVLLEHMVNEGEKQAYKGLHNWNFYEDNGDFMISSPDHVINVSDALSGTAQIECERSNQGTWIITRIRKLKQDPYEP